MEWNEEGKQQKKNAISGSDLSDMTVDSLDSLSS